jgi:toxin ParE1/3/4
MIVVHIREEANGDLLAIWDYTVNEWGEAQAEKYLAAFDAAFLSLAQRPAQGRETSPNYPGIMTLRCGSHSIVFNRNENRINILRILHQSMDFERHL